MLGTDGFGNLLPFMPIKQDWFFKYVYENAIWTYQNNSGNSQLTFTVWVRQDYFDDGDDCLFVTVFNLDGNFGSRDINRFCIYNQSDYKLELEGCFATLVTGGTANFGTGSTVPNGSQPSDSNRRFIESNTYYFIDKVHSQTSDEGMDVRDIMNLYAILRKIDS